jgi:MYXO-CTERM domain-containing protein
MPFVKRIAGRAALGAAMLVGLSATPAGAGYIVTLEQIGSSVIATGSGPIDLSSLSPSCPTSCDTNAGINPRLGTISTGPVNAVPSQFYTGFAGPTNFGSGDFTLPNSGQGDIVAIDGTFHIISLSLDYVSGNPLSDSSTYDKQTLSSLGVTPGTYEWTWGPGANQNFTLNIVAAAVPEPSALSELGVGLAGLALAGMLRKRRQTCPNRGEAADAFVG